MLRQSGPWAMRVLAALSTSSSVVASAVLASSSLLASSTSVSSTSSTSTLASTSLANSDAPTSVPAAARPSHIVPQSLRGLDVSPSHRGFHMRAEPEQKLFV